MLWLRLAFIYAPAPWLPAIAVPRPAEFLLMVNTRRGFTLIELLIVVVIIGIIVAMAIPRLTDTKGRALTSTMKSDLRNVIIAEESHYFQHGVYTAALSDLPVRASTQITLTITSADAGGFSATATSPLAAQQTCAVFYGAPPSIAPPAVQEGKIACQ